MLLLPLIVQVGVPCSGPPPRPCCCTVVARGSVLPRPRAPRVPVPRSEKERAPGSLKPAGSRSPASAHLAPRRGRVRPSGRLSALHPGSGLVTAEAGALPLSLPPLRAQGQVRAQAPPQQTADRILPPPLLGRPTPKGCGTSSRPLWSKSAQRGCKTSGEGALAAAEGCSPVVWVQKCHLLPCLPFI